MVFLSKLRARAARMGWQHILDIPHDTNEDPEWGKRNILEIYGEITMTQITSHIKAYIHTKSRMVQDTAMMYNCIMNSLQDEVLSKVIEYEEEYKFGNMYSGVNLLKVIIRESTLDTNATTRNARCKLASLNAYMETINQDILQFNQHVKDLLLCLSTRGETKHDIIVNLFNAYDTFTDTKFRQYMTRFQDNWDDGYHLDAKNLMKKAVNKYLSLK